MRKDVWRGPGVLKRSKALEPGPGRKGKVISDMRAVYSTVTDFAMFLGWSTSQRRRTAMWWRDWQSHRFAGNLCINRQCTHWCRIGTGKSASRPGYRRRDGSFSGPILSISALACALHSGSSESVPWL